MFVCMTMCTYKVSVYSGIHAVWCTHYHNSSGKCKHYFYPFLLHLYSPRLLKFAQDIINKYIFLWFVFFIVNVGCKCTKVDVSALLFLLVFCKEKLWPYFYFPIVISCLNISQSWKIFKFTVFLFICQILIFSLFLFVTFCVLNAGVEMLTSNFFISNFASLVSLLIYPIKMILNIVTKMTSCRSISYLRISH